MNIGHTGCSDASPKHSVLALEQRSTLEHFETNRLRGVREVILGLVALREMIRAYIFYCVAKWFRESAFVAWFLSGTLQRFDTVSVIFHRSRFSEDIVWRECICIVVRSSNPRCSIRMSTSDGLARVSEWSLSTLHSLPMRKSPFLESDRWSSACCCLYFYSTLRTLSLCSSCPSEPLSREGISSTWQHRTLSPQKTSSWFWTTS